MNISRALEAATELLDLPPPLPLAAGVVVAMMGNTPLATAGTNGGKHDDHEANKSKV